MQRATPITTVNLLPNFDPYTLAVSPHSKYILSPEHKPRVYRTAGWMSLVVLVGGRIEGVWEYERKRAAIHVKAQLFGPTGKEVAEAIEAEAQRLGEFLNAPIELSIEEDTIT
jgi:hypothetical protein